MSTHFWEEIVHSECGVKRQERHDVYDVENRREELINPRTKYKPKIQIKN